MNDPLPVMLLRDATSKPRELARGAACPAMPAAPDQPAAPETTEKCPVIYAQHIVLSPSQLGRLQVLFF